MYFFMEDGARGSTLPKFIGTLWAIWCLRNNQIFRQQSLLFQCSYRQVPNNICFSHKLAVTRRGIFWIPPSPQGLMWPTQGKRLQTCHPQSYLQQEHIKIKIVKVVQHGYIRDTIDPSACDQQGFFFYSTSTNFLEATACLRALIWAQEQQHRQVQVCTASKALIRLLRSTTQPHIHIHETIARLRDIGNQFTSCRIVHVSTTRVAMAHKLALWCRQNRIDMQLFSCLFSKIFVSFLDAKKNVCYSKSKGSQINLSDFWQLQVDDGYHKILYKNKFNMNFGDA